MLDKDRKKALKAALDAACLGGKIQLKYFRKLKMVEEKLGAGLVSEADRESEKAIVTMLRKKFPDFDFLGEEGGLKSGADFRERQKSSGKTASGKKHGLWIIDPLDGTTNYVHGFPFFCVSIGLEIGGEIQVGVVHAPLLRLTFMAIRGGGAFVNGKSIHVSSTARIEDSLLATGFSYNRDEVLDREISDFRSVASHARGVRRAGSAALDMCFVAQGVFDGFWERKLAQWDTAAGHLIVEEAGGIVTDFSGDTFHNSMPSVVAANPKMHPVLVRLLKSQFAAI